MQKILLGALMLVTATALSAKKAAPTPEPPPPPSLFALPVALMIAGFDRNADGEISREEFDAGVKASFPKGQDSLSLIDLSRWAQIWLGNAGALPGQFDFDSDGDDRVSREEYAMRFDLIFRGYDADKNERLTRAELLSQGAPCRPAGGVPGARPGGPKPGGQRPAN